MSDLQEAKKQYYGYLNWLLDEKGHMQPEVSDYIKELENSNDEMREALIDADEAFCNLCKHRNPQYEHCQMCYGRKERVKVIEKATGRDDL